MQSLSMHAYTLICIYIFVCLIHAIVRPPVVSSPPLEFYNDLVLITQTKIGHLAIYLY